MQQSEIMKTKWNLCHLQTGKGSSHITPLHMYNHNRHKKHVYVKKSSDDRSSQETCIYILPLTKIVHEVSLSEKVMKVVFVHMMIVVHLIIPFLPERMIYIFNYKHSS